MTQPQCPHDEAEAQRKVIHDVNTHGWHVMCVTEEPGLPGWAYSIGLFRSFRHPEVIVFGLAPDVMHRVINLVGDGAKLGTSLADHSSSDDLLENYRCTFRAVNPIWYRRLLGYATWFYGSESFPVLQCFWPDRRHQLPWAEHFEIELIGFQPLLYNTEPKAARAVELLRSIGVRSA